MPFEFSVLSAASKSLPRTDPLYLQVVERDADLLVFNPANEAAQLSPRPSAWAALRIRLELLDEVVEYRPKLKKLTLDLRYTARDTATKRHALFVSIADGIRPRIGLIDACHPKAMPVILTAPELTELLL